MAILPNIVSLDNVNSRPLESSTCRNKNNIGLNTTVGIRGRYSEQRENEDEYEENINSMYYSCIAGHL